MKLYTVMFALIFSLSSMTHAGSFRDALKDIGKSVQENLENGGSSIAPQVSSGPGQEATWRDSRTGLTWRLCALGSKWREGASSAEQCSDKDGRQRDYTWWDAALAVKQLNINGYSDWRLPTLREAAQVHEYCDKSKYAKELYDWEKYKTNKGEGTLLTSCIKGKREGPEFSSGNIVLYKRKASYIEPDSSLWTSSMGDGEGFGPKDAPWRYNNDKFLKYADALQAGQENDEGTVLVVRGVSNGEFDTLVRSAVIKSDEYKKQRESENIAYNAQAKIENEYRQAEETRARAFLDKGRKQNEQRQKNAKRGEKVMVRLPGVSTPYPGLILEVRSDLVRVQIMNPAQELWVRRDQLYF